VIGESLSHFHVDARLGEGGMGVVYRATDERLRREVALKVLPESLSGNGERRARFLREARSAAAVTHPNIATVYEVGEARGHVFIAMELVAGATLRDRMAPGLEHVVAVDIARQVARGLARAHEKGVVHRDLKPENVMVTPDGDVKILDFGLAKLRVVETDSVSDLDVGPTVPQLTAEGRPMGTPSYMSPEQVEGRAEIDARSDVFSFGVMLYEMLAGVRPFRGATSVEVMYGVLRSEAEPLQEVCPSVAPELAAVVARCLRKDCEERYASGRELVTALEGERPARLSDLPSGRALPAERIVTVSGMGTALGATLTSEGGRSVLSGPVPPRQSPRRRPSAPWLGLVLAAVVVGVALWANHRRTVASTARVPVPPASTTAGPGVAMTDHPAPKTSSAEAAVHYASALWRLRVGALESQHELARAASLDPSLAPAHLRLALYGPYYASSPADRRSSFSRASLLASSLEPRDAALLPVAEALALDPVDLGTALARARSVAERYPQDAEVALVLYTILYGTDREDERLAAFRRVLELDPLGTQVLDGEAYLARGRGESGRARELLAQCIERVPAATYCRQLQAWLDAEAGSCDAELAEARELVKLDPDAVTPYAVLAQALLATGAPLESVRGALGQAEARTTPTLHTPRGIAPLELAVLTGDFESADTLASALALAVETFTSEQEHAAIASLRISLAEEAGDVTRALQIANAFERESSAWNGDAPLGVRARRLYLLHASGALGDAGLAEARERLIDASLRPLPGASPAVKERERIRVAASYAKTRAEALEALGPGGMAAVPPGISVGEGLAGGRLLLLAGRGDEALPRLQRAVRSCSVISGDLILESDLAAPLDHVHAQLLLGQALEARGDRAGACAAYGSVQARWGGAKPRSVTLDAAKGRIKALRCPR